MGAFEEKQHEQHQQQYTLMTNDAPTKQDSTSSNLIRALQFNVWLDATKVKGGLGLVVDTIIDSNADIVSLIEVKNIRGDFVQKLVKELEIRSGSKFYGKFAGNAMKFGLDADTAILSRYPILEQKIVYRTRENCIVRSMIELPNNGGTPLAVYSLHLEYRYYTCYLPRGYNSNSEHFRGWSMINEQSSSSYFWWFWQFWERCWEMLTGQESAQRPEPMIDADWIHQDNIASTRPDAIQRLLDDTKLLENKGIPILVMGDFNEPSTLDWTDATTHMADHNGLVYQWDSTELLKQNGYVDCYREVYPNPVTHPGFTWPAAAQGMDEPSPKKTDWIKKADERDRIDFIFYKHSQGFFQVKDAWLVGTPITVVRDEFIDESRIFQDKYSHAANSPWPSDHRAVMTVFDTAAEYSNKKTE